jgi:beta-lactamase superfamily II metal-dependent hydrolase
LSCGRKNAYTSRAKESNKTMYLKGIWIHVFVAACAFLVSAAPVASQNLEVRFLDVGQGDAVLIRNGGKVALIDTGPSDAVVTQLQRLGVRSLDLLVASHNHADHIGGADAILQKMPVRNYLDNGYPATTGIQKRVLGLVEQKGVQYLRATGRTITLGDASLRIIPSPITAGEEQNNRSVAVLLERGSFKALFTGDSEYDQIAALLRTNAVPAVNVLKAAHHGSRNGVTPAWLARTKPEVVVISLGAGNTYGHPHAAALRYYEAGNRRVFRTDQMGDVVIIVDAQGRYQVRGERGGAPAGIPQRGNTATPAPLPAPRETATPRTSPACCRICRSGKACGDACIAKTATCRKASGCACDG